MRKSNNSYENDFYKWTQIQSSLLKKNEFSKLDLDHIIEEIETLGRSERSSLKSQFVRLLQHMLKYKYQIEKRTKSWAKTIANSRLEIDEIVKENPSLKREIPALINDAYLLARKKAHIETGIDIKKFPVECPWSNKDILNCVLERM